MIPRPSPHPGKRRRALGRRLKAAWRRVVAETRYWRLVWRTFRGSLLLAGATWAGAVLILHAWYPVAPGEEPMAWSRAAYYTLMMTTFGSAPEYHEAAFWPVKAVYFALPLLGLFVLIDAFVRLAGLLFTRRANTKEWQELLASTYQHHVIVCGLGHVGIRIVQQLVRSGTDCVAIDSAETEFVAEAQALGVPVLIGDARKVDTLQRAQVARADALIAATDQDLVNIEIGLNARELSPELRVVLRLFDQALAKKIEKSFSFEAAFSAAALAAPVFAAAAVTRNVINSFVVGETVLNTVEIAVRAGSRLEGRTVDGLRAELEATFLMLQVGAEVDWNPAPDRVLVAGAKVVVVTTTEALAELEELNQERRRFTGLLGDRS